MSTLLEVTKAKKQFKRELGIYKVTRIINSPKNTKRRMRRALGLESELARFIRFFIRTLSKILKK